MNRKNKAIFLDRDGVINEVVVKNKKPFSPRMIEDFRLISDIERPLSIFKELGFLNIIVTNQPDVARGFLNEDVLGKMNAYIKEKLSIDDIILCPHDDRDMCFCRKPKPGLILKAEKRWNLDLEDSYVIGDTWRDVEAGKRAGCKTILINRPYNSNCKINCDFKVNNLNEAEGLLKKLKITK